MHFFDFDIDFEFFNDKLRQISRVLKSTHHLIQDNMKIFLFLKLSLKIPLPEFFPIHSNFYSLLQQIIASLFAFFVFLVV